MNFRNYGSSTTSPYTRPSYRSYGGFRNSINIPTTLYSPNSARTASPSTPKTSSTHFAEQPDSSRPRSRREEYPRSKSWKKPPPAVSHPVPSSNHLALLQSQPLLKQLFMSAPAEDFCTVSTYLIHKQTDKLIVWNIVTGECSHIFCGHTSDVTGFVAINPETDTPRVLSCSSKETLLWDLVTGNVINHIRVVPSSLFLDPHRENRVAVFFSGTPYFQIWDFGRHRTSPSIVTLQEGDSPVTSLAYFRKRQKLVASYSDRTIRIWNLLSNQCELTLKEDQDIVSTCPIRDHVIVITIDGYCHIWPILPVKISKKVLSQRVASPVTNGVRFVRIVVTSLEGGYAVEEGVLRLTGGRHFPDSYRMTSLDTLFRVTEREQVIIGQFNNKTLCFVLSKENS